MGFFSNDKMDVGLIIGLFNIIDPEAASGLFADLLLFVGLFNTAEPEAARWLFADSLLSLGLRLSSAVGKDHSLVFLQGLKASLE